MSMTREPHCAGGSRDNNLNLLRLALAVLVLCSHSYPLLYGELPGNAQEPLSRFTGGQVTGGTLAVACFFILSGYLIAQSWGRSPDLASYAIKRARRIYPGFVVASLVSALAVPILSGQPWQTVFTRGEHALTVIRAALLMAPQADVFAASPMPGMINASLWTVQYEWWCYVLVAALGLLGVLRRPQLVFLLFAAILMVYALQLRRAIILNDLFPPPLVLLLGSPQPYPRFLLSFMAGVGYYLLRARIPASRQLLALAVVVLIVTARTGGFLVALPLAGTYLLLCVGLARGPRLSGIPRAWPDLSYGVYLYAFPIQQLLVQWAGSSLTPALLSVLALAIVCPLAALSWYLVEQPSLGRTEGAPLPGPRRGLGRLGTARS